MVHDQPLAHGLWLIVRPAHEPATAFRAWVAGVVTRVRRLTRVAHGALADAAHKHVVLDDEYQHDGGDAPEMIQYGL